MLPYVLCSTTQLTQALVKQVTVMNFLDKPVGEILAYKVYLGTGTDRCSEMNVTKCTRVTKANRWRKY